MNFVEKLRRVARQYSSFCLGVDPSAELLRQWRLQDTAAGLDEFCSIVLQAAGEQVGIYKAQSAFFERLGPAGLSSLQRLGRMVRERNALFIVDCKRGDIGHSMAAYADALVGSNAHYSADAITLNAFMGYDSLRGLIDTAVQCDAGVFVVVRSSNPEGAILQNARVDNTRTVSHYLADEIYQHNLAYGNGLGPVGAVIGATAAKASDDVLDRLGNAPVLAPGLGAQGASYADISANFGRHLNRTLVNSGRAVLACGPDVQSLERAVLENTRTLKKLLPLPFDSPDG